MRPSFPIEQQQQVGSNQLPPQSPVVSQQGWWSEPQPNAPPQAQNQFVQPQQPSVSNNQEQKQEVDQQRSNQPVSAQGQTPDQFGQGFPQPQFPVIFCDFKCYFLVSGLCFPGRSYSN